MGEKKEQYRRKWRRLDERTEMKRVWNGQGQKDWRESLGGDGRMWKDGLIILEKFQVQIWWLFLFSCCSPTCWGFYSSVRSSKIFLCVSLEAEPDPSPRLHYCFWDVPLLPLCLLPSQISNSLRGFHVQEPDMILLCFKGIDPAFVCVLCAYSVMSLCNPTGCRLPGSSVHGVFQTILEYWNGFPFPTPRFSF